MPTLEPASLGLTTTGRPSVCAASRGSRRGCRGSVDHTVGGHRQSHSLVELLGDGLVHGQGAAQHARSLVGNPQQVQQALHGSVLAIGAVQDDQGRIDAVGIGHQARQIGLGIVAHDIVFLLVQGLENLIAAAQRHLALRGNPTGEQGQSQFGHDVLHDL